uniref:DNA-directed DNA polymerase n=1 Tax=Rhabditophanes sp. KR3021 TaxID=114890 RepID=A0AC35TP65_9BILA
MSWEQQAVLLLESIRTHFKSHRIVIYNLGISPQYLAKFKRICNVVIKSFDFKWYPPHVSNLSNSAWKSLIIADALREYEVIWQVDPTVRFQKNVLTQISSQVLPCTTKAKLSNNITSCGKSSFMFNQRTSHVLPASIHKNTLKYLPTEIPKIGKISSYTSSSLYVIRTDYTMNNIVKWHVLCALTQDCIAPLSINTQTNCRIINGIQQACHRFDESIINLLLVNAYGYTNDRYFSNIKRLHSIKRDKKQQLDLQLLQCK